MNHFFTKNDPNSKNISSSVVTPPVRTHASQMPSPAPGDESQEALRSASVLPLHCAPGLPAVQPLAFWHGPPSGIPSGGGGEVLFNLTSVGSLNPLSYRAQ